MSEQDWSICLAAVCPGCDGAKRVAQKPGQAGIFIGGMSNCAECIGIGLIFKAAENDGPGSIRVTQPKRPA